MEVDWDAIGFEDLRGQTFRERYDIAEVVYARSHHVVFTGVDKHSGEAMVLRLARPPALHDDVLIERFEKRMAAASKVEHEGLVTAYDWAAIFDGNFYAASLRPPGVPLEGTLPELDNAGMPWPQARSVLLDLARALTAAHDKGVIHASVSPRCIWVESTKTGPRARLLDLGVAIAPDDNDDEHQASSRTATLRDDAVFMAPETASDVLGDERSDVYVLGLIAYTLLTGRPPYEGRNGYQLVTSHLRDPVPPMSSKGDALAVPATIEAWVQTLLAKAPDDRPPSMRDVEAALARFDDDGERRPELPGLADEPMAEPAKPRGRAARRAQSVANDPGAAPAGRPASTSVMAGLGGPPPDGPRPGGPQAVPAAGPPPPVGPERPGLVSAKMPPVSVGDPPPAGGASPAAPRVERTQFLSPDEQADAPRGTEVLSSHEIQQAMEARARRDPNAAQASPSVAAGSLSPDNAGPEHVAPTRGAAKVVVGLPSTPAEPGGRRWLVAWVIVGCIVFGALAGAIVALMS